ncbi:MAG: DedA family protein [Pseudomonadota bacterium]
MELIAQIMDIFLHLDQYLGTFIRDYGSWIYLLLFLIVFAETGLVVMPFLPGDSLLFVTGTLAAAGGMDVAWIMATLIAAAFCGDNTNYWVGHHLGPRVFRNHRSRLLNPKHLEHAQHFYERHGAKAVVIGRFLPIIRTFVPFVAGVGRMPYGRFLAYSVFGTLLWVISFVLAGYFFGNIPVVKRNLTFVILLIIVVSLLPGIIEYWRHRRRS